jgi:hypothetical protein
VDPEIMLGLLSRYGWEVTGVPEAASLRLVNTRAFIALACQKCITATQ